ncbi:hypothetical protein BT96DRAFT_364716 [Gymnopus androsaceus JB14]|uniref:Uncharacterized protein n=1 Tax=Gymnopus androsaceus JB14 TaxID=1447944 RepID=A0A6A4GVY6_9AGAR|nr:hypothetical protein BT96DRAFT_364716 [Gymnopus androsaceus JB14]
MPEVGTAMDPESVLFVIPRQHFHSPTPPPISYEFIQIPNLHMSFAFAPPYQPCYISKTCEMP